MGRLGTTWPVSGAICLALLLGACSSDEKSAATTSGAPATTAAAAPASAPTSAAASAGAGTTVAAPPATVSPGQTEEINPCGIVTPADVAAVFGGTVADGVPDEDNGGCDYEITGTTNTGPVDILAEISIQYAQSDYISFAETKAIVAEIVAVDGVGDEAWYLSNAHQLHISTHGTELLISGALPGDDAATQAEVVAFGAVVVGKLG